MQHFHVGLLLVQSQEVKQMLKLDFCGPFHLLDAAVEPRCVPSQHFLQMMPGMDPEEVTGQLSPIMPLSAWLVQAEAMSTSRRANATANANESSLS
jgi:hypothetical protein